MNSDNYTISPTEVLALLQDIQLPPIIEINQGETVIEVPLFISVNISRMYCGSAILEKRARRNMMAMERMIQTITRNE